MSELILVNDKVVKRRTGDAGICKAGTLELQDVGFA
jgi:hypothetical protein